MQYSSSSSSSSPVLSKQDFLQRSNLKFNGDSGAMSGYLECEEVGSWRLSKAAITQIDPTASVDFIPNKYDTTTCYRVGFSTPSSTLRFFQCVSDKIYDDYSNYTRGNSFSPSSESSTTRSNNIQMMKRSNIGSNSWDYSSNLTQRPNTRRMKWNN